MNAATTNGSPRGDQTTPMSLVEPLSLVPVFSAIDQPAGRPAFSRRPPVTLACSQALSRARCGGASTSPSSRACRLCAMARGALLSHSGCGAFISGS
jgi:hypothetical protein